MEAQFNSTISLRSKQWQVIYVWPYLEWGGAQIYFMGIMKLAKGKYRVRAVMPEGSDPKIIGYLQRLGVSCSFFNAHTDSRPAHSIWGKIRRRINDACCAFVIARCLSREPLERTILHLEMGPWSWFGLLMYLSLCSKVFVTLHIAIPKLSLLRSLEFKIKFHFLSLTPGFHLIVSNREMRESLAGYMPKRFLSSVRLAYTGIDAQEIEHIRTEKQDRDAFLKKYALPPHRFMVLSVGQLVPRKGCKVLLDAMKTLSLIHPEMFFIWIGDGSQKEEILSIIDRDRLADYFRIIPSAQIGSDRLDILRLVQIARLFVHPSFQEGLPGAVLEAMALGKPCIASRVNAIPEVIVDNETGLLVPPGDSEALTNAIHRIYSDSALRDRLAVAGRELVLAHFDERIAAQTTVDYYDTCIRGK
jgi:glycosyltransferase involved in cell wall biosynthesis